MKIIVFSDTHLSHRFSQKKFQYLKNLINVADKIIINGDFWDYYRCDFDAFVKSDWKDLFPLLKAKNTIYVLGNHDQRKWLNKKVFLFSQTQLASYSIKVGNKKLIIKHGNDICPRMAEKLPNFPWREINARFHVLSVLAFCDRCGLKLLGKKNFALFTHRGIKNNNNMIAAAASLEKNEVLVTGHSHCARYSPEKKFINIGCVHNGFASYLMIDDNKMTLVKERY